MGGPGVLDHNGCFTSQYIRVQVNNCLDNQFDIKGGNTDLFQGCYAEGVPTAGKCGYRIHGGRPTMEGCNGIGIAGVVSSVAIHAQYGYVFSDNTTEDGVTSFCMPTLIGCNCEDAMVIGIRNKNGGVFGLNTTILAPSADVAVTFTGAFSGTETSGTLSAAWPGLSGPYYVEWSSGDVRIVVLTNGATTATWTTGLSTSATANANTNTVDLLVDSVNEPGWCNNTNVLLGTKGATLANGTGLHTRSANAPFYLSGNQVTASYSFYNDTGANLTTMGSISKASTIASLRYGQTFGDTVFNAGLVATQRMDTRETVAYSASMTPDATAGNIHEITANNGTGFTINVPSGAVNGQWTTIVIKNTSGGSLGTITWGAGYHLAGAYTAAATGNNRAVTFYYNNSVWYETSRAAADVAN